MRPSGLSGSAGAPWLYWLGLENAVCGMGGPGGCEEFGAVSGVVLSLQG